MTKRAPRTLISDVGNLRLFEGSPDLEVHTSAAAETALLVGLVAIIAAPFSVMHGAVQFLVHGQARSGGSAHATENPSRLGASADDMTKDTSHP